MSLVMSLVTNDFAVMTGDLRATHAVNHDIKKHDIQKVFKVNDNSVIGITGDLDIMYQLLALLKKETSAKTGLLTVARLVRSFLVEKLAEIPDMQNRTILTGIDGGQITLIHLDYEDDFEMHVTKPKPGAANWMLLFANTPVDDLVDKKFNELESHDVVSVKEMLAEINYTVAQSDDFVSPECDALTIEKR